MQTINLTSHSFIARPPVPFDTPLSERAVAMSMGTEEFGRYLRQDVEKWARIVKLSGAKPDQ